MADNSRAWMAVHTKGSKQMRQRLNAAQANNPAYQEFIQKHGLGDIASAKQSEMTAKKPKAMSPTAPEPNDGSKDRLAAIKAAAEKARQRKELDKRRAAMSDWGGTGGKMGGFSMPSFRTYREEVEQMDEKDLTGALRKSIESKGEHTVARNKAGTLVLRKMKKEEVELQEQFKTKEAAHTYAIANSKDGYDIDVYKHPNGSYHVNHEMNSQGRNWLIKAGAKKVGVASKGKIKEEVEQADEAVRIVRGQSYKAPNTQSDGSQEYTGDKSAYGSSHRDELAKMAKQARKTPEGRAALKPNIPRKPKGRGLERRATDKGYYDKQSNVVGSGNKSVMAITREEVEYIEEKLTAADPASSWISDFVNSDNPKFAGKSKKERMNMALGAYYAKKRKKNEEVVQEKLDPVGKETTDIDNDKDVDKTDRYLHARRQAIGKAIARKKGM